MEQVVTQVNTGRIEQRQFERIIAVLNIKYYIIDEGYASKLSSESAYKDTTLEKLQAADRVRSPMTGVTENISKGGLSLTSDEPLAEGQKVIVDMTLPNITRPMRALAEVVRSDSKHGKVMDRTIKSYNSGLKILAINKDDMRRIENYMVEEKIRSRMNGR